MDNKEIIKQIQHIKSLFMGISAQSSFNNLYAVMGINEVDKLEQMLKAIKVI